MHQPQILLTLGSLFIILFLYFEGAHCETNIDDCQSNQCENNGTCVDGLESYYCNCQAGFEGKEILVGNS